jgi:hypothetical protein
LISQATLLHPFFIAKEKLLSLHVAQKKHDFLAGSLVIQTKDGSMLNIHSFQVQPIHDSEGSDVVQRAVLKKLSAWLHGLFVLQLISKNLGQSL